MKAPSLTIGVEEEYQIIDPQTRELQSYITQLLEYDHRFLGQVKPELHQSIVEVGTTVTVAGTLVTSPSIKIVGDEANPIVIRGERVHADLANEP